MALEGRCCGDQKKKYKKDTEENEIKLSSDRA